MQYSFRLAELLGHIPDPRKRPGTIKAVLDVPRTDKGGRDWDSFTADPVMRGIAEQVMHLVHAERVT